MAEVQPRDRRLSDRLVMLAMAAALGGTLVLFGLMRRPEAIMSGRGYGIVPFELAFTVERARTILEAWGEQGREAARTSLLIDFGFIPSYALLFSTVGIVTVRR